MQVEKGTSSCSQKIDRHAGERYNSKAAISGTRRCIEGYYHGRKRCTLDGVRVGRLLLGEMW